MLTIGLTGGIGSGKSVVANLLQDLGVAVIDADVIAHQLTASGGAAMPAIQAAFGDAVIRPDGALNRTVMRDQVFADARIRQRLQAILHPMIQQEMTQQAQQARGSYIVLVIPLLVESGHWRARLARICVVDCEEDTQCQRVQQRNGMTIAQIHRIMQTQATRQARLAAADDVIHNGAGVTWEVLGQQVRAFHQAWRTLAETARHHP